MAKGLSSFRSVRRAKSMSLSQDSAFQARGADGQYRRNGVSLSSLAVVVTETRQQRRHLARQAAKRADVVQVATEIWDDVTGGAGVVLVDGKPVKTATQAKGDKGKSKDLP